jgi:hypothetical protein
MAKKAQNISRLYDVFFGDSRRFLPIIAGNTPFGYYDNDSEFVRDARRVCGFVAVHLGVGGLGAPVAPPIKAISDMVVLATFEEAVTTYGNLVYQYKIRDNYINMEGGDTLPFRNNTNTYVISDNIGSPVTWSTSRKATWKEIEYDIPYSQSVVDGEIFVISSSLSDYIAPDFDYIKSFGFTSPYSSSLYGLLDLNQYNNNQFNRVGGPTIVTPFYNPASGSFNFSSFTSNNSIFSITGSNTVRINFKVTSSNETDTATTFYIQSGSTSAITAQNIANKIANVSYGTFGTTVSVNTGSTTVEILTFTSSLSYYNIVNYKINNTTVFSNIKSGSNYEITEGNTYVYFFPTSDLIQSGSEIFDGGAPIPTTYIQSNLNPALNDKIVSNNFTTITSVISDGYGAEAGVGGKYNVKKGTLHCQSGVQDYDLNAWAADSASLSGSGDRIEIKRVFFEEEPAIARYFDPYAGTGTGIQSLLETFGFGQFSPGINFLLMPISFDAMKLQAIELNDQIRKSAYSFDLVNNQLRIFPVPHNDRKLFFEYVTISQKNKIIRDDRPNIITDVMNVPYRNPIYTNINTVGRLWIFRYTAALCKLIEGETVAKLDAGVAGGSVAYYKGGELTTSARTEIENLINELKEMLNETSRRNQLERKQLESQYLRDTLQQIPLPIYIL